MPAQPGQLLPRLAPISRAKQSGIFHPCINRARISQRRLYMPHSLELPWMRRAVVPLMRARNAFVGELISYCFPRLPAVTRALYQLPEPAGGLRCIQPLRIGRRSFQMVDLPTCEVWTLDTPVL